MVPLALVLLTDVPLDTIVAENIVLQLAFVLIADVLLVPIVLVTLVHSDALLVPVALGKKPCSAARTRTAHRITPNYR